MTHTLLIIEHYPFYHDELLLLGSEIVDAQNILVANSIANGVSLLRKYKHNLPALILLDLTLPGMNSVEAISMLRSQFPTVSILALSASEDRQAAKRILQAGVKLLISSSMSALVVIEAIQRVLSDSSIDAEWITPNGKFILCGDTALKMTQRQQEILALLIQGHSNKVISQHVGLADITVRMHVSAIFRLLGVKNRTQAVSTAIRYGLESKVISMQ